MLTRECGYEAVAKLRTSAGIRIASGGFYGRGYRKSVGAEELYFANIDADIEFAVALEHDGTSLKVGESVYVQLATLYTRRDGRRVIRVHNLALKVIDHLPTIFRHASIGALMSFLTKRAAASIAVKPLREIRGQIFEDVVTLLHMYRKNVATRSKLGQLILPESLKLSAIYVNAFFKSDVVGVNTKNGVSRVRADARAAITLRVLSLSSAALLGWLYPRLVVISPLQDGAGETEAGKTAVTLPLPTWCSSEKLELDGVYLLHDGERIMMHFGEQVSREVATMLLGSNASTMYTDPKSTSLIPQGNPYSARVMAIVGRLQELWEFYGRTCPVYIMNGKLTSEFNLRLVEDKTYRTDSSYIDFLVALHKKIQTRMKK